MGCPIQYFSSEGVQDWSPGTDETLRNHWRADGRTKQKNEHKESLSSRNELGAWNGLLMWGTFQKTG